MVTPECDVRSISLRLLRDRPVTPGRRLMLDRIRPRAVLVGVLLAGLGSAAVGPAASASPGSASPGAASPGSASPIGGPQLGSRGVVLNNPSRSAPLLPNIKGSAFVVADASTGQVLAAKDPHGWYRPASTLKVLTAVALIPLLNPDAGVVASKQATSTVPNVVGLVAGRAYKISDLFTALLTISANDAAIALTQASGSFSKGMALINAGGGPLRAAVPRQALTQPAFLKYDQTISARFVVARHKTVTLFNQNSLLTNYPGPSGGRWAGPSPPAPPTGAWPPGTAPP